MSEPVVNIANLPNSSAVGAIISCAKDFFTSIKVQDIPVLLNSILDNLKAAGKYLIDKIYDFIVNDFWNLIVETKNTIVYLINQQLDKALNCAERLLGSLEKVLDVLSYIPCLSVVTGVILIVIYACQQEFAQVALAALCMLGPLKLLTKVFPQSRFVIKRLTNFLLDFSKRFKTQAATSLQKLCRQSKVVKKRKVVNIQYGNTLKKRNEIRNRNTILCQDGTGQNIDFYDFTFYSDKIVKTEKKLNFKKGGSSSAKEHTNNSSSSAGKQKSSDDNVIGMEEYKYKGPFTPQTVAEADKKIRNGATFGTILLGGGLWRI